MKKFNTIIIDIVNIIIDAVLGIMENIGILDKVLGFFGIETIDVNFDDNIDDNSTAENEDNNRAIQNGWNPDDHDTDDIEHFALSEEERKFIREQEADELQKKFDEQDLLDEEHGDESDLEVRDQSGKPYRMYTKEDIISSLESLRKNAENIDEACVFGFVKYKVENPDAEEQVGDIYNKNDILNAVAAMREMYLNIPFGLYYDYLYEVIKNYKNILEEREKTEVIPF